MLKNNGLTSIQKPIISKLMIALLTAISIITTAWITFNYLHFKTKLELDLRQSIEIAQKELAPKLSNLIASKPELLAQVGKVDQSQRDALLAQIKEMLSGTNARIMNYTTVVDQNGTLVVQQPNKETFNQTIFDLLDLPSNDPAYQTVVQTFAQKKDRIIIYKDQAIGQLIWLAIKPIELTNLSIVSVVYPADIFKESLGFERHHIFLISLGIVISLSLILILIAFFIDTVMGWWIVVFLISLMYVIHLTFLWYQAITRAQEKHTNYTQVIDRNQLDAFITQIHDKTHDRPLTLIPTGVFIEEMVFSHEANGLLPFANINGYIWQRYSKKLPTTLKKDFLLPDAFLMHKNLISQKSDEGQEILCWQFNCKLYETTTLLSYPFDHRHINLRIVHPEILDPVMLIPDFNGYRFLNPYQLPGISSSIDLSNWHMYSSFFCYKNAPYNANLGIAPHAQLSGILPQMSFSILCQRTVIGEFMSYLILILLSVTILFILLLSFSKHEHYAQLMGFNNISIITALSGLLFVLIISQISLRQNLDITGISYIESFYFICYFLIIAIAINSILFVYGKGGRLVQYGHNLIPKLIYWPLFFFLTILATLVAFY